MTYNSKICEINFKSFTYNYSLYDENSSIKYDSIQKNTFFKEKNFFLHGALINQKPLNSVSFLPNHKPKQFLIDLLDYVTKMKEKEIYIVLKKIQIISEKFFDDLVIMRYLLYILNKIFQKYYTFAHPRKRVIIILKESIYQISNKIVLSLKPSRKKTIQFEEDSFLIKIDIISEKNSKNYEESYSFAIDFNDKNHKNNNKLQISFPLNLLFLKNNIDDKNESLNKPCTYFLQTIIWKIDFSQVFKDIVSYLFSFDIYDKRTNKKLIFHRLKNFSFEFSIPNLHKNHSNKINCQFWEKIHFKWKKNGCKFMGFDINSKNTICACNHLTEFGVGSQRSLENLTHSENSTKLKNVIVFYINT